MPFPTTTEPLVDPDVRIFFEGLLILRPVTKEDDRTSCEVVIVNPYHELDHQERTHARAHEMPEHHLTVEVLEDSAVKHPMPLVARVVGPLTESLEITLEDPQGVEAFVSGNDATSLNSALDLQRKHPDSRLDPVRPSIKFHEGQLIAAVLSGPKVSQVAYMSVNDGCTDIGPIATIVEARIRRNGRKMTLTMGNEKFSLEEKEKYVIYVRNSRKVSLSGPQVLTDFRHYYAEPDLSMRGQKWDIYWKSCVGPRDTTKVPCMSVLYGGI